MRAGCTARVYEEEWWQDAGGGVEAAREATDVSVRRGRR